MGGGPVHPDQKLRRWPDSLLTTAAKARLQSRFRLDRNPRHLAAGHLPLARRRRAGDYGDANTLIRARWRHGRDKRYENENRSEKVGELRGHGLPMLRNIPANQIVPGLSPATRVSFLSERWQSGRLRRS